MKSRIFMLISLVFLSACNLPSPHTPIPTGLSPSATPIPPSATLIPPTNTPVAPTFTPIPDTPVPQITPDDQATYLILQSNSLMLGGVRGNEWLNPEEASQAAPATTLFQFYDLQTMRLESTGTRPEASDYPPCMNAYVSELDPPVGSFSWVGISSPWEAAPRTAEPVDALSPAESAALEALLVQNNTTQASYQQVTAYRVDLEGDGNLEIVLSAVALQEETLHSVSPGEYSLAAVLFSQPDGTSLAVPLTANYYFAEEELAFPSAYAISALLDLNGDGKLEIVLHDKFWEGNLLLVYEINGNTPCRVLSTWCGPIPPDDPRCGP